MDNNYENGIINIIYLSWYDILINYLLSISKDKHDTNIIITFLDGSKTESKIIIKNKDIVSYDNIIDNTPEYIDFGDSLIMFKKHQYLLNFGINKDIKEMYSNNSTKYLISSYNCVYFMYDNKNIDNSRNVFSIYKFVNNNENEYTFSYCKNIFTKEQIINLILYIFSK